MDLEAGNFELKLDESGKMDIFKNGKEIIRDLGFFLNFDGEKIFPENCDFEGVEEEEKREDGFQIDYIRLDYEFNDNKISLIAESYQSSPCIDFHVENDFDKPLFENISGGLTAKEPEFDSAVSYNNSGRGLYYWLKTAISQFSTPWFILKPTIKHMVEALPVAFRKALRSFSLSGEGMDWDSFAYPDFVQESVKIPDHTHCLFTKIRDQYLGAVASTGSGQKGFISGDDDRFSISSMGGDKNTIYGEIPCGTLAVSEDPYEAAEAAYLPLNKGKEMWEYPEAFKYLGCCTWNSLYENVSDDSLRGLVKHMVSRDIPLKTVIIDDGWQEIDDSKRLLSYEPSEAFSEMSETVDEIKSMGVEHVGVWHALQGDWEGVSPEADIPEEALFFSSDEEWIPSPGGTEFYEKWYESLSEKGIDFVKVDNQFDIIRHIVDKIPIEEASTNLLNPVYRGANKHLETVLNCMSMVPECIHKDETNLSRNSIDYIPYSKFNAKHHLRFNIYNSLWVSNITHPDYDMFQSHDPYARPHALSKILSGGPVYLTDMIGKTDEEIVKKLSFDDGKIPRPDEPAKPTEDCLLKDPYTKKKPLKAFAKVGEIGLVEAFNIHKDGAEETVTVKPTDARLPEDDYVVYGYFSEKHSKDKLMESLEELECELFIISSISKGFAPIGLLDIYNPPKGIENVEMTEEKIDITLYQSGECAFYCEFEPEKVDGVEKYSKEDSILKIQAEDTEVTIYRNE